MDEIKTVNEFGKGFRFLFEHIIPIIVRFIHYYTEKRFYIINFEVINLNIKQ